MCSFVLFFYHFYFGLWVLVGVGGGGGGGGGPGGGGGFGEGAKRERDLYSMLVHPRVISIPPPLRLPYTHTLSQTLVKRVWVFQSILDLDIFLRNRTRVLESRP